MSNLPRRYENDLPRYLLIGALIGFVALLLTVIAYTVGTHHGPAAPAPGAAPATTTTGGSPADQGKQVFIQAGCGGCHTFAPAGTNGAIGPDLAKSAGGAAADRGMALAAYLRQSITDPDAYIASGYKGGVMPSTYGSSLSSAEIAALVAFIAAGQTTGSGA